MKLTKQSRIRRSADAMDFGRNGFAKPDNREFEWEDGAGQRPEAAPAKKNPASN
jgi:hypothetical protein